MAIRFAGKAFNNIKGKVKITPRATPILPTLATGMGGSFGTASSGQYLSPAVSADGQTMAVHQTNVGVQIFKLANGTYTQQQTIPVNLGPVSVTISDDGSTIAYSTGASGSVAQCAVFVYTLTNGTYVQTARLVPNPGSFPTGTQPNIPTVSLSMSHDGRRLISPGSPQDCILVWENNEAVGSPAYWILSTYPDPHRSNGSYGTANASRVGPGGIAQSVATSSNYPTYVMAGYTYGIDVRNGSSVTQTLLAGSTLQVSGITTNRTNTILVAAVSYNTAPYLRLVVIDPQSAQPYYATKATLPLPTGYTQPKSAPAVDPTGTRIFIVVSTTPVGAAGDLFEFTYRNGSWSAGTIIQSGVTDVRCADGYYVTVEGGSSQNTLVIRPYP